MSDSAETVADKVEATAHQAANNSTVQLLGRFGFATKGLVYILIGIFAILAALGQRGGETTDSFGVIQNIAESRLGRWGIAVLGVGFAGYALWQVIRALADVDDKGRTLKGLLVRFGYLGIALLYGAMAATIALYLFRLTKLNSDQTETLTARILAQSWGNLVIFGIAAGVVGFVIFQFYNVWSKKFEQFLDMDALSPKQHRIFTRFGQVGYAARGIVFAIVAVFLFRATFSDNAREIKGFDDALTQIAIQPSGRWLLAIVALGLLAYGFYTLVESRYRKFYPERSKP